MILNTAINEMTNQIVDILLPNRPSVFLYGSCTREDFRPGWSDIDILVLTKEPISDAQADRLLCLRQRMVEESGEPVYRCFEGGMLMLDAFLCHAPAKVVYWGTSGQRITDRHHLDACCRKELLDHGRLLFGEDIRDQLPRPSFQELTANIQHHYETIRRYADTTGRSMYSFGWILDISRGIYTLRTGDIISKTGAGEWALENRIFSDCSALETALAVRRDPKKFHEDTALQDLAENLGHTVQQYADVLKRELQAASDRVCP